MVVPKFVNEVTCLDDKVFLIRESLGSHLNRKHVITLKRPSISVCVCDDIYFKCLFKIALIA